MNLKTTSVTCALLLLVSPSFSGLLEAQDTDGKGESAREETGTVPFRPGLFAFQNGVKFRTVEERVKVLKELGYDGIGSARPGDLAKRWKLYEAAGLKIHSIYVGATLQPDGFKLQDGLEEAIRQLEGRDTVVEFTLRGHRSDEQAVAATRRVADLAAKSGLKVVLYPHAGFHVATLGDAVRIARLSQRKNVGAMFNLCHFLMVEPKSDLRKTLEAARPYLWRASTCGAEPGTKSWKTLIQPLDVGSFDQVKLLAALRDLGFRGPMGLQCYAIPGVARVNLKRSAEAWRRNLATLNSPKR